MTRPTMETCDFRNKLESAPCETGAPYPQGEKKNFPGEKKKKNHTERWLGPLGGCRGNWWENSSRS